MWVTADRYLGGRILPRKACRMDRKALKARLEARCREAIEQSLDRMDAAPRDNIIGGSEMQFREVWEDLKRVIYQELVQAKVKEADAAAGPRFSPSRGPRRSRPTDEVEGQGPAGSAPADGQR